MKDSKRKPVPRLRFTEEERSNTEPEKPIAKAERASDKRDAMKARLRKEQTKRRLTPDDVRGTSAEKSGSSIQKADDAPGKPLVHRLHFEAEPSPSTTSPKHGVIRQTAGSVVRKELHREISKHEEDNTGLQAAHATEQGGEKAFRTVSHVRRSKLRHDRHQLEKAEKRLDRANVDFLQKKQEASQTGSSNPLSRLYQRQRIKREYIAAKAGHSASLSGNAASKAVRRRLKPFAGKKKHVYLVLALVAMLGFLLNAMSSCAPLLEAGMQAFVMGTYPAEEADIKAVERAYQQMERELQDEMAHYESRHSGHDEYVVQAQDIWHDPYALIAIISAYHGGEQWTIDDVYGTLEMLFRWQYEKTETIATEIRYRTEWREGTRIVTDPVTGETRTETYAYEEEVPYTYSICAVTLKNKNLSHAPVYIMSREKMGLYALYMSTLGNMPDLFAGNPYASKLKDPLRYDVPQELLDADPQFAKLVEEANKRLGYPYVWGGYTPDTSFDCSGFVSWLFTETGVDSIGHMGATGLYGRSRHISPGEAKPGDVIFFTGTLGEDADGNDGVTHCGLYVGNNMMVHCGNPCSYADLTDSYWQQHFLGYGRLYEH